MKRTLLEFEAWSVCESDDDTHHGPKSNEVFAEHFRDCEAPEADVNTASWSWEFDDPPNDDGKEICWRCGGGVPEEVVALVQLHNWGRKRRNE